MNRLAWIVAVYCGLLCGCSDDGELDGQPSRTVTRSVRIAASVPSTRTELAPDGYNVLWSPGDRIGVYVKSGDTFTAENVPLVFEGTEAAAGGVFSGDITLADGASEYTLYAYYPYSEQGAAAATSVPFTLAPRQAQAAAGDSSHLGDYDFLVAGALTSATGEFGSLSFRHAFAVVEVDLTGSGIMAGKQVASVMLFGTDAASVEPNGALTGLANMAGGFSFDLTASSGNNTAAYTGGSAQLNYCGVDFTTPPTLGTSPLKTYLTVNAADYSRGNGTIYVVVRTTDGFTATYSRRGIVIGAGQMKVITQDISDGVESQPVTDLMTDGEAANCYVVSVPSQEYSFDATVPGNGVVTDGLQQAVQRFEGRTLSTQLTGTSARLLWQSMPYLIEPGSVVYDGGKIRFTLTEHPTQLGGNAVIGLFAGSGATEALWSWHIWITDKSNDELLALAETYVMFADYEDIYGRGAAVMMDRNLGAVYKEDGAYARSFRAPLYQWGRKDPFPWGTVVFDEQSLPHTYITTWRPVQSNGSPGQYTGYTGNTWYATAHPDRFIATVDGTSYDWYYGGGKGNGPDYRNNELWGNPAGYTVGQTTTKTLFDPCPPGWKVPHPYVFSAFTKTGASTSVASGETKVAGSFIQGWNFYYDISETTYYPGVGYRYDEFGVFAFAPSGYYWTSAPAPSDTFGAWVFGLTAANVYQRLSDPRGFGLPVRCMKE